MPAEHRLTMAETGIYGKHPGFGDFIASGLAENWPIFGDWAQEVLGLWRDGAGPDWQADFDAGRAVRFWIGPALCGNEQAMRGVWLPSRDRSSRRFPLVVAQAGGLPPVLDPAQEFYNAAARSVAELAGIDVFDPRQARAALDLPQPQGNVPQWPRFWAVNRSLPVVELWHELAATDHAHASAARSYWWFATETETEGGSGALCCQGWPDPRELGWLIAGGKPAVEDAS